MMRAEEENVEPLRGGNMDLRARRQMLPKCYFNRKHFRQRRRLVRKTNVNIKQARRE